MFLKCRNPTPEITELLPNKWEPNDGDENIKFLVIGSNEPNMGQTFSLEQSYKLGKMLKK